MHLPGNSQADQVEMIYYTDPLCCWSWAVEPQVRKLLYEFNGKINIRYCMGGLLPNWNNYYDEINEVSKPIQMGPVWMHAQQISGMPMESTIWMKDAPISSYPACIAVKCAQLQSAQLGEKYLRLLREAVMLKGINIARENTLVDIAAGMGFTNGQTLGLNKFKTDLTNDNGLEAFRKDLLEAQTRNINRFPTLVFKSQQHKGIIMTGFFTYQQLVKGVMEVLPGIIKTNSVVEKSKYLEFWGNVTKREIAEIE